MERRKLTKEDIDKVRNIEGFPIGTDEDIIALSDAPFYTACPNPFIEDFIKEYGTPYDEATDDYHREPFAADVSEGKNDPIYNAHSYHTKVPYKAIMRYILHYTEPGDIVFDGFAGTGMTGVAAQKCKNPDRDFMLQIESTQENVKWGERKAVLCDLAVAAAYISANYNQGFDISGFEREAKRVLDESMKECGWMYETTPPNNHQETMFGSGNAVISNTVWSSVLICPNCGKDFVFYTEAVDESGKIKSKIKCPHCGAETTKNQAAKKEEVIYDELTEQTITRASQVPVFKIYRYAGKKYEEPVNEFDRDVLQKIDAIPLTGKDIPAVKMLFRDGKWGDIYRSGYHKGFTHTHHFYTRRNLLVLSAIYRSINKCEDLRLRHMLLFALTGCMSRLNRTNKWLPSLKMAPGPISGMLYIPSLYPELNVFNGFQNKVDDIKRFYCNSEFGNDGALVTNQSTSNFNLFWSNNTFRHEKSYGISISDSIDCFYAPDEELQFTSFYYARQVFDLSGYYRSATTQEVTSFTSNESLCFENAQDFENLANSSIRRKIAAINDSEVLKKYQAIDIKRLAQKAGISITVKNKQIVIPNDKEQIKVILGFLDEEAYRGPFSQITYLANSKRKVPNR